MKTVYLAGPISGQDHEQANGWRIYFSEQLKEMGIKGISPVRSEPTVEGTYKLFYEDICFGTKKAIAGKNRYDVKNCDLTLAYLPSLSVGTIIEVGWARGYEKPVIVVSTLESIVEHPLIEESSNWIVPDFTHALNIIEGLLGDYT